MLSNKVAAVLNDRLLRLCNNDITEEKLKSLSVIQLQEIGLSAAKCSYIKNFTEARLC